VGINILEESGNLQRDELEAIFHALESAPLSTLCSPITGKAMAEVTFLADDDTEIGNVGANARTMTIEGDVDNYFAGFSFEELRDLPLNTPQVDAGSSGLVDAGALGRGDGLNDGVFMAYENDIRRDAAAGVGGLFGGFARRIRG
jgi:hypothetical protein